MFSARLSEKYFQIKEKQNSADPPPPIGSAAVDFRLLGMGLAWGNALSIVAYCILEFVGMFQRCYCDCLYLVNGDGGWLSFLATDQIKKSVLGYWIWMLVWSLLILIGSSFFLWYLSLEYIKKGMEDSDN